MDNTKKETKTITLSIEDIEKTYKINELDFLIKDEHKKEKGHNIYYTIIMCKNF